jgi:hypothetical protein
MSAILGQIAIDHQRVADLDVTLLPAAARQGARTTALAGPVGDLAVAPCIDVEIGVRVGPFDLGDLADQTDRLAAVEFG